MANTPGTWPPDDSAVSARLAAIEERLGEINRRLDELRDLVATLNELPPDRRPAIES